MKCPCCGQNSPRTFLIAGDTIHYADGRRLKFRPYALRYFNKMLAGEKILTEMPARFGNALYVHMSNLRKFIREAKLPYRIIYAKGVYTVEEIPNEQNNNPAEHSKDVHSRSGVHDL